MLTKKCFFILLLLFVINYSLNAQVLRVAILDFENISGIAQYDGLGKAMSSMLISDIEANVSPKRLQLVERAQIQKLLKEQSFQTSGSVDKSTAVEAGKILGVGYLLVGDIYILDDQLIINARLTNTETGDIVFSKKQEGKTLAWLTLKTIIAKELALNLSQPFIDPTSPDAKTQLGVVINFANAIMAKDMGDLDKADILIQSTAAFVPNFKYLDELSAEITDIRKDVDALKEKIDFVLNNPIEYSWNLRNRGDTIQAKNVLVEALNNLSNEDPFILNKRVFLLYNKARMLLDDGNVDESEKLVLEIRKIEPFFMKAILLSIEICILKKEFLDIYKIQDFVVDNQFLFYTLDLKKRSKLFMDQQGPGYIFSSSYQYGNSYGIRQQQDVFILPIEFSNQVVGIMAKQKEIDKYEMGLWWYNSLDNMRVKGNFEAYRSKPFHHITVLTNMMWSSALGNPSWGLELIPDILEFTKFINSLSSEEIKDIMLSNGFKPRNPFFKDDMYIEAFVKSSTYLNLRLNLAHILYLNGYRNEAYEIYCQCRMDYDSQYVTSVDQMVKDYASIIKKDWIDLKIVDDFNLTFCDNP